MTRCTVTVLILEKPGDLDAVGGPLNVRTGLAGHLAEEKLGFAMLPRFKPDKRRGV